MSYLPPDYCNCSCLKAIVAVFAVMSLSMWGRRPVGKDFIRIASCDLPTTSGISGDGEIRYPRDVGWPVASEEGIWETEKEKDAFHLEQSTLFQDHFLFSRDPMFQEFGFDPRLPLHSFSRCFHETYEFMPEVLLGTNRTFQMRVSDDHKNSFLTELHRISEENFTRMTERSHINMFLSD